MDKENKKKESKFLKLLTLQKDNLHVISFFLTLNAIFQAGFYFALFITNEKNIIHFILWSIVGILMFLSFIHNRYLDGATKTELIYLQKIDEFLNNLNQNIFNHKEKTKLAGPIKTADKKDIPFETMNTDTKDIKIMFFFFNIIYILLLGVFILVWFGNDFETLGAKISFGVTTIMFGSGFILTWLKAFFDYWYKFVRKNKNGS